MQRIVSLFIVGLVLDLAMGSAVYGGSLDVKVSCPTSAFARGSLSVTVSVKNTGLALISFDRAMAFLGGNAGNSFGLMGMYGPFNRDLGTRTLAAGASTNFSVEITNSVPSALTSKVAAAGIQIYDGSGKGLGGDACAVPIN